jgi:hypothetical protein
MERKEIIELAKKNGMVNFIPVGSNALWEQIEKFVTIAIEEEREACAKVCDDYPHGMGLTEKQLAQLIRARGEPTSRGTEA